jgi:trans-aconitate methyltransferase
MNEAEYFFKTTLLPQLLQCVDVLQRRREEHNHAIDRLLEIRDKYDSIADLGCGTGERTLILMLRLKASDIIGID